MLIELDGSDEPAWAYLEYQHAHIMDKMRTTFAKASDAARGMSKHCFRLIASGCRSGGPAAIHVNSVSGPDEEAARGRIV